jgi:hypothetical protein
MAPSSGIVSCSPTRTSLFPETRPHIVPTEAPALPPRDDRTAFRYSRGRTTTPENTRSSLARRDARRHPAAHRRTLEGRDRRGPVLRGREALPTGPVPRWHRPHRPGWERRGRGTRRLGPHGRAGPTGRARNVAVTGPCRPRHTPAPGPPRRRGFRGPGLPRATGEARSGARATVTQAPPARRGTSRSQGPAARGTPASGPRGRDGTRPQPGGRHRRHGRQEGPCAQARLRRCARHGGSVPHGGARS